MRVMVCDDHRLVAESVALVLELSGHEVVAIVDEPEAALRVLETDDVEVCVMDLQYREGDGCSVIASMTARHPDVRVVVLSGHLAQEGIDAIREAGAAGWAVKRGDLDSLVQLVVGGGADATAAENEVIDRWERDPIARFITPREREVLEGVARGESTAAMARRFGVSRATVRTHVQNVLSKLGVHSRLEAVAYATGRSLIEYDRQRQSA